MSDGTNEGLMKRIAKESRLETGMELHTAADVAFAAAGHTIGGRRLDRALAEMSHRWVRGPHKGSDRATRRAEASRARREARRERVYLVKLAHDQEDGVEVMVSHFPLAVGRGVRDGGDGSATVVSCTAHYARDLRTGQRVAPRYATLCPTTKKEAA